MFNLGAGEIVVILVAALLILGPKRLPELARGMGKFLREFRRQTDEVRSVVEREFYRMDLEEPAGSSGEATGGPKGGPSGPHRLGLTAVQGPALGEPPTVTPPAPATGVVPRGVLAHAEVPSAAAPDEAAPQEPPGPVPVVDPPVGERH